jgi:hypothetical protein
MVKPIVGKEQSMKQALPQRLGRGGKVRTILTLCLGGAVCGGYVGVPLGGLVGLGYGIWIGELEFAFAGAVLGFLFFALMGIVYGAILGIKEDSASRPTSTELTSRGISRRPGHHPRVREQPQGQKVSDVS